MLWKELLDQVLTRQQQKLPEKKSSSKAILTGKKYQLNDKGSGVILTEREAQCILLALRGKTAAQSGEVLNLSQRTVEFYLTNIKTKMQCRTKSTLIAKILKTNFMQLVDFDFMETC